MDETDLGIKNAFNEFLCNDADHDVALQVSSKVQLNSNITLKAGKKTDCRMCGKRFNKAIDYDQHWHQEHGDINPSEMYSDPVQCKLCNRYLKSERALISHEVLAHRRLTDKACLTCKDDQCGCSALSLSKQKIDNSEDGDTRILIGCRLCKAKIYRPMRYDQHWKIHHRNVDQREMYDDPQQCEICQRFFSGKLTLKLHLSAHRQGKLKANRYKHTRDNKRYCPICGTVVDGYSKLQKHLDDFHGGLLVPTTHSTNNRKKSITNDFTCEICGDTFVTKYNKRRHLSSIHPDFTESAVADKIPLSCDIVSAVQPFKMYPLVPCPSSNANDSEDSASSVAVCSEGSLKNRSDRADNLKITDTHTTRSNSTFVCHVCGSSYNRHKNFVQHFFKQHDSYIAGLFDSDHNE